MLLAFLTFLKCGSGLLFWATL